MTAPAVQSSPLLSPAEAAETLGISKRTLAEHVRHGEISYIDVGRGLKRKRIKYDPDDIERFKDRRRKTSACPSPSAAKSTTTNSGIEVYDFAARLEKSRAAKQGLPRPRNAKKPGSR